jgi:hypothetical protein
MVTSLGNRQRRELEDEYFAWAKICEDKHGLTWPVSIDDLPEISDRELVQEIKKLKELGRTPYE